MTGPNRRDVPNPPPGVFGSTGIIMGEVSLLVEETFPLEPPESHRSSSGRVSRPPHCLRQIAYCWKNFTPNKLTFLLVFSKDAQYALRAELPRRALCRKSIVFFHAGEASSILSPRIFKNSVVRFFKPMMKVGMKAPVLSFLRAFVTSNLVAFVFENTCGNFSTVLRI